MQLNYKVYLALTTNNHAFGQHGNLATPSKCPFFIKETWNGIVLVRATIEHLQWQPLIPFFSKVKFIPISPPNCLGLPWLMTLTNIQKLPSQLGFYLESKINP